MFWVLGSFVNLGVSFGVLYGFVWDCLILARVYGSYRVLEVRRVV